MMEKYGGYKFNRTKRIDKKNSTNPYVKMNYKELQQVAYELNLPANIKHKPMLAAIIAKKQGRDDIVNVIVKTHQYTKRPSVVDDEEVTYITQDELSAELPSKVRRVENNTSSSDLSKLDDIETIYTPGALDNNTSCKIGNGHNHDKKAYKILDLDKLLILYTEKSEKKAKRSNKKDKRSKSKSAYAKYSGFKSDSRSFNKNNSFGRKVDPDYKLKLDTKASEGHIWYRGRKLPCTITSSSEVEFQWKNPFFKDQVSSYSRNESSISTVRTLTVNDSAINQEPPYVNTSNGSGSQFKNQFRSENGSDLIGNTSGEQPCSKTSSNEFKIQWIDDIFSTDQIKYTNDSFIEVESKLRENYVPIVNDISSISQRSSCSNASDALNVNSSNESGSQLEKQILYGNKSDLNGNTLGEQPCSKTSSNEFKIQWINDIFSTDQLKYTNDSSVGVESKLRENYVPIVNDISSISQRPSCSNASDALNVNSSNESGSQLEKQILYGNKSDLNGNMMEGQPCSITSSNEFEFQWINDIFSTDELKFTYDSFITTTPKLQDTFVPIVNDISSISQEPLRSNAIDVLNVNASNELGSQFEKQNLFDNGSKSNVLELPFTAEEFEWDKQMIFIPFEATPTSKTSYALRQKTSQDGNNNNDNRINANKSLLNTDEVLYKAQQLPVTETPFNVSELSAKSMPGVNDTELVLAAAGATLETPRPAENLPACSEATVFQDVGDITTRTMADILENWFTD